MKFWSILYKELLDGCRDRRALSFALAFALFGPVALVLGGEHRGLRRLVREHCDVVVRLPMSGKISSLKPIRFRPQPDCSLLEIPRPFRFMLRRVYSKPATAESSELKMAIELQNLNKTRTWMRLRKGNQNDCDVDRAFFLGQCAGSIDVCRV